VITEYDADANRVLLRVTDEGPGISEENLKRILDPFFTTKRDAGGTGLGLSISYNIAKDHGGKLDFNSEPGKGTTV
ncbi:MAG: HAMP domain-containing histidine kinase, partial [candidate division Zixibacteria bacterium]|nr:HAMP domain-containing histidine kinase [candidate division Zixibacteria bacterium]NIX59847.1 histidine kinase [candidate division Zixibacteria bacterium]